MALMMGLLSGCSDAASPKPTDASSMAGGNGQGEEASASNSTEVLQVSAGNSHTCVVMGDHTVRCWGLGSGVPSDTAHSISGLRGAVAVAAGSQHSCALMDDGTVRCWGVGGVADASQAGGSVTVSIADLTDVRKISAGEQHTCALLSDGDVRCWGANSQGQVTGARAEDCTAGDFCSAPVTPVTGLPPIVDLAAGGTHTCALDKTGNVWCWGSDFYGEVTDRKEELCPTGFEDSCSEPHPPTRLEAVSNAIQVDAGERNSCALLEDGTARCWGANNGESSPQPGSSARAVYDVTDATSFSTGGLNTCVTLKDRSVRCWGAINSNLDGPANDRALAALNDVIQLEAGGQHVCAVSANGTLRCWGLGGQRQVTGQLPKGCTGLEDACFFEVTQIQF